MTVISNKKTSGKKKALIIVVVTALVLAALFIGQIFVNPYWGCMLNEDADTTHDISYTMTGAEAKADLDYLLGKLKKDHPAFLHSVPVEVQAAYDREVGALGDTVSVLELWQAAARVVSPLKDAHTSIYPNFERNYMLYTWENNDKGYTLTGINGKSVDELFSANKQLFSYESEIWGMYKLTNLLSYREGLAFLGIDTAQGVSYTFDAANGEAVSYSYSDEDFVPYDQYILHYPDRKTDEKPFVYYDIDEQSSTAVLTLTACNYNKQYKDCVKAMFAEVKQKGINNVIVDLRNNGGGNSMVANEFIKYLPVDSYKVETGKWRLGPFLLNMDHGVNKNILYSDLTFSGKVYALVSNESFSSAMLFAEYLTDNGLATLIGEELGNMPTGYGDIANFRMPNSKLCFYVSTKQFFRADSSKLNEPIVPDIECKSEKALDKAREIISLK